jgi:hypothetical protein
LKTPQLAFLERIPSWPGEDFEDALAFFIFFAARKPGREMFAWYALLTALVETLGDVGDFSDLAFRGFREERRAFCRLSPP